MKLAESTTTLMTLIPQALAIIDLNSKTIAEANPRFQTLFGIAPGSPVQDLDALFEQTPLLDNATKTITMDLQARRASTWPQFSMHTMNNGLSNFDLHLNYLDESRTSLYLIFSPSAQDLEQMEQQNSYYETISASSFSYPFYLNIKTRRMEFFGPIMEQFKLPEMMENFPDPVIAGGMILEEDLADYLAMVERMYKGEPPTGFFRSYTPNGDILGYTVNYTVKLDEDGQPSEIIGDFINKQADIPDHVPMEQIQPAAENPNGEKNKVLVHQIKAHFFFNTLNTISALCKQDVAKADKAIQTFAAYMRSYMYLITEDNNIPFDQELSMVRSSLEIERMRFPDSFTYTLDLKCRDFELPPLSLQPIVENALLHGLRKTGHHGQLRIATERLDDVIQIVVEDDGRGFDTAILKESKSIGLKNMVERVKLMVDGTVTIESQRGKGTRAVIEIPAQAS